MSREIKFRAWDNKRSIMIGSDYPDNWADESDEFYCDVAQLQLCMIEDMNKDERFVVMQYTGLNDKNGQPIYEGDILQVAGNVKYEIVFLLQDQYEETICSFGLKGPKESFAIDHYAIVNGEVIGNIHENPALI